MKEHKATKTKSLPQYINSEYTTDKFLKAIHQEDTELEVAKKNQGINSIENNETLLDGLDFFDSKKKYFEKEFSKVEKKENF